MSDELEPRHGLRLRILVCAKCNAAWPTERAPEHGGSRQDGEPCAYRWDDGRVCDGTVYPAGFQPPPPEERPDPPRDPWGPRRYRDPWDTSGRDWREPPRRVYVGNWCDVLGLPWGTTDLARVRRRYRELAKQHHPDVGGDTAKMATLNDAYRQALAELGQRT